MVSEACLALHEAQQHERHDSVLNAILDVLSGTDKLAAHPNLGCHDRLVLSIVVVSAEIVGGGGRMEDQFNRFW